MNTLETDLRNADPAAQLRRDETALLIDAMARDLPQQRPRRGRWWSNWRLAIPVGVVATLAVTGAALAPQLFIWINGEEASLDARIPITYTTHDGATVECFFGATVDPAKGGSAEDRARVAAFLNENDWTGIGQEIYDYAIANPLTSDDGDWADDSPEARDRQTLKMAIRQVILTHLPAELLDGTNVYMASTDNCEGQL
jgi:hypothetical protein